ncbi:MAG: putative metallopeptidase [Thermodesulfobacteriota bacterium]
MSAKFEIADNTVEEIAERLVEKFSKKFLHINLQDVYFAFKDSQKSKWRAQTSLIKGVLSSFTKKKVAVTIWKQHWVTSDEVERMLILYHEFLHLIYDDDKKNYVMVRHDIENFREMLMDFGIDEEKAKQVFGTLEGTK